MSNIGNITETVLFAYSAHIIIPYRLKMLLRLTMLPVSLPRWLEMWKPTTYNVSIRFQIYLYVADGSFDGDIRLTEYREEVDRTGDRVFYSENHVTR
ncbi:hypothetical protein ACN38_g8060 [Penicillium nordicum]|uniref:Uncharacterized protein n=1 Tax=Penicillium nordicum TaxID=229535 RepID=A0A0M8P5E9_9EURO|nr:hypothetical protein ACN38_g8060 [Penicillium nordicum]